MRQRGVATSRRAGSDVRERPEAPGPPACAPRRAGDKYAAPLSVAAERHGATLSLHLAGDLDLASISVLEGALNGGLRVPTRAVIFDLKDVTFLDMAGLTALLRAGAAPRRDRFDVAVIPPAGRAGRILALTHADAELTLLRPA
jgi:anti-anti-sigma factor